LASGFLIVPPAFAADMTVKAPPAAASFNWTGFYAGLEGGLAWGQSHISNNIPPFASGVSDATREHWLGTGRVRLGVVPVDRRLFYVTGGFAAAGVEAIVNTNIARDGTLTATQTRWGWTAGGGFEAALFQNWSLKLE
jgi:outer membrane immunogenic protein